MYLKVGPSLDHHVNAEHIDVLKVQYMIVNSDVHQLLTVANKHNDG